MAVQASGVENWPHNTHTEEREQEAGRKILSSESDVCGRENYAEHGERCSNLPRWDTTSFPTANLGLPQLGLVHLCYFLCFRNLLLTDMLNKGKPIHPLGPYSVQSVGAALQSPWLLGKILDRSPLQHRKPAIWHSFCRLRKDDRLSQPHLVLIQWPMGLKLMTLRSKSSLPNH